MSDIGPAGETIARMEILAGAMPPSASPDPAFSRIMNEAISAAEISEAPLLPATKTYNSNNLLNGQYPPPDSGAGYTFTSVSLRASEAA